MLTVGGLFSGIGGWELGLERAGMRVLWHCEADPYARAVLDRHWPGVPCYDDVCDLHAQVEGHPPCIACAEPVDVLCGGFPCQDLSYAGAGAGIDGARSGLWSEYARLVGELRPRYVLVENVSALLGRGLGRVLGDLAALGYDAEWDCLPASAFGAPHQRDRVWLVAYPGVGHANGSSEDAHASEGPSRAPARERGGRTGAHSDAHSRRFEERSQRDGRQERPEQPAPLGRDADGLRAAVADTECEGLEGHRRRPRPTTRGGALGDADVASEDAHAPEGPPRRAARESSGWGTEPDVGRVAHGVPARVDRLAALGNALVPQIAEWIGGRVIDYELAQIGPVDADPEALAGARPDTAKNQTPCPKEDA